MSTIVEPLYTPFVRACSMPSSDTVRTLLADPSTNPASHASFAIYNIMSHYDNADVMKLVLADGRADPMVNDGYALVMAILLNRVKCAHALLDDPRVDPSVRDNRALLLAVRNGHLDIVERLLADPRVDPSSNNNQCIRSAMIRGHLEIAERLVSDRRVLVGLVQDISEDSPAYKEEMSHSTN